MSAAFLPALVMSAYTWLGGDSPIETLEARFSPPTGFAREPVPPGSFAAWLRGLPLKPGRPEVRLFDGRRKANQDAHAAVIDIDVGTRDLQQCADAVIRLRAEYLFASGRPDRIAFRFTSGHDALFARWAAGERPVVRGAQVSWKAMAPPDAGHRSLRRYLDVVFTYAGSQSLAVELLAQDADKVAAGDVFIKGGFPGHAVLVLDTARDPAGRRAFLLAQSYMPAQEIHVLRNPAGGTWYQTDFGPRLETPEWTFARHELRRFP